MVLYVILLSLLDASHELMKKEFACCVLTYSYCSCETMSLNCILQRAYCLLQVDIWVCSATMEWYWQDKTEQLGEKSIPVSLCPPQILHGLTRTRTQANALRGQRLTTWAMARSLCWLYEYNKYQVLITVKSVEDVTGSKCYRFYWYGMQTGNWKKLKVKH
jgi:hypothetical protein